MENEGIAVQQQRFSGSAFLFMDQFPTGKVTVFPPERGMAIPEEAPRQLFRSIPATCMIVQVGIQAAQRRIKPDSKAKLEKIRLFTTEVKDFFQNGKTG